MSPLAPLPYEWLGALALAILWVNTLLVAAAALQQRRGLGVLRARLAAARRSGALVEGIVEEGHGPGGALAVRRIEQIGRAMTVAGPDRILFTDRRASAESFGGRVRVGSGATLGIEAGIPLEVWIDDGAPARRDETDFDRAWSRASTHKGVVCICEQAIVQGARVFVDRSAEPLRIATMDPLAFVDRKRALLAAFAVFALLGAAAVTVVACWPPLFGPVSTLGAVLAVAYFLGIQPLGTSARDAARLPPERLLGGVWSRPERGREIGGSPGVCGANARPR